MARLARVVVPNLPHHVTQRGNRREPIFFADSDREVYCALLAQQAQRFQVEVWAYCLMPNHVHLILVPRTSESLSNAVGEAHRRYTNFMNARVGWTGHLFQRRFASVVLDEEHLKAAISYVSLNPVRSGLATKAEDWKWSSVRAHLAGKDDFLVSVAPVLARFSQFADLLEQNSDQGFAALRRAERTGRPAGADEFIAGLEHLLGRRLARRPPGRKPGSVTRQRQLSLLP